MNPVTHFLAGWATANIVRLDRKERAAITIAGIAPDIDGIGIFAERLTSGSERTLTWWSDYHHVLAHNLYFGLLVAAGCFLLTGRKRIVAWLALLSFHLHLLGDLVGAGGPGGEHWPISYLWPVTDNVQLAWQGQWLLNAWQNVVLTVLLLAIAFAIAHRRGCSPLEMISGKADIAFVGAIRNRFGGKRESRPTTRS